MEEYGHIKSSMIYAEVVKLVGKNGENVASSSTTLLDGVYTIDMYTWYGNKTTGANAVITFENGKVSGKAQSGLR